MNSDYYVISGIVVLALVVALVVALETGAISDIFTPIAKATTGSASPQHSQVREAVSFLNTGTFNNGGPGYTGMQRGPVYPLVLAAVFSLFGLYVGAIHIINFLFLALAIVFLWRLSKQYFKGGWEFIPPLALVLVGRATARVWVASYETLTLFLSILAIFAFLEYRSTGKTVWLVTGTAAFSLWVLEKPAAFYFIPVFLVVTAAFIGSWSLRNHRVIDTWQLGSGGHAVLLSSSQVDFNREELVSLGLSLSVGDFIGSRIYKHYPQNAKPKAWDPSILDDRWYQQGWYVKDIDGSIITKTELDKRMYAEAVQNIKRRPMKFLLTGIFKFMRLNAPENHRGQEITHLFVGTYLEIPTAVKAAIILFIRIIWFMFLVVVLYAMIKHIRDWSTWGILFLVIFYYNGAHAFLTHALARYILVILPFYFIFFTEGVRILYGKYTEAR